VVKVMPDPVMEPPGFSPAVRLGVTQSAIQELELARRQF
jgi:hypothetical protein